MITTCLPVERRADVRVAAGRARRGSPPSSPTACGRRTRGRARRCRSRRAPSRCCRESKTARKPRWASTSAGMPSRPTSGRAAPAPAPVLTRTGECAEGAGRARHQRQRSTRAVRRTAACGACAGGVAEGVDHVDRRCGSGLTRWKASPSRSGEVGEVVHRLGDVVDRHDVGVAEVDADQRQPGRQGVAQIRLISGKK